MTESRDQLLAYLGDSTTAPLIQILESMTDQKPSVTWKPGSSPEGDVLWWGQILNVDEAPLIWVGAPEPSWHELGGRTLRAAGIETVETPDARNTYLEILNQALSGLAQSIGERLGREVTCVKGDESAPPPDEINWLAVEIVYTDAVLPIYIGFHARLTAQMAEAAEPAPSASLVKGADRPAEPEHAVLPPSKTLDLLLDVEMPVSVSFGRAELLLRDVMKLTTGSIVELNRGITEPVEVIVNNCVVARGEVVVMDGNYGVRIHQIISPQERLRTLK